MISFKNRESVVAFVNDTILSSDASSPWIMTIILDTSGAYYASSAISFRSEGIDVTQSKLSMTTCTQNTQAG